MHILSKMPYSLARAGPKAVDGFGNYVVKIRSADEYVSVASVLTALCRAR